MTDPNKGVCTCACYITQSQDVMETMTGSISLVSGSVLHQCAILTECEGKLIQHCVSDLAQYDQTEKVIRKGLTGLQQNKEGEKQEN